MRNYRILFSVFACLFFVMSCGTGSSDKSGSKTDKVDMEKIFSTKLTAVAEKGDLELVKEMVEAGVDINQKTPYGETALMRAAQMGHIEVVEYLLSKNPDLYVKNIYGYDVSVLAQDSDNEELIGLIKKAMEENPKSE
jgi:ankyrin repeat protein